MSSYDEVPYSCCPYPQTHPDRLATIATLFGMQPAAVDKCRVLVLGCGTGQNLLPMAMALPNSQFLGLDLSGRQVAEGKRTVEELGLKNIELRHQNIAELPADSGPFDYIISPDGEVSTSLQSGHFMKEIRLKGHEVDVYQVLMRRTIEHAGFKPGQIHSDMTNVYPRK